MGRWVRLVSMVGRQQQEQSCSGFHTPRLTRPGPHSWHGCDSFQAAEDLGQWKLRSGIQSTSRMHASSTQESWETQILGGATRAHLPALLRTLLSDVRDSPPLCSFSITVRPRLSREQVSPQTTGCHCAETFVPSGKFVSEPSLLRVGPENLSLALRCKVHI